MKLTLRPEWRLRPLCSFLGFLDLKTGVTVALLFAVLNKVAGVYGLVAVLTGAGGSAAQLSLYIYSVLGLIALAWGLKAITQEDPKQTLYFAHLFFADHVLSTAWTVFFAVVWWVYTPHDGRRQANSAAQEELMKVSQALNQTMTPQERIDAAMMLWDAEKGRATAVIVLGWLSKIYFALLLYSFATHLRKGSYRSLPLSRGRPAVNGTYTPLSALEAAQPDEDEEIEDFYRLPVRAMAPPHSAPAPGSASVGSFADFVSAPGRGRRFRAGKSGLGAPPKKGEGEGDDVLFDEDEHVRAGTEESGSYSGDSPDEDRVPLVAESSSSGSRHSRKPSQTRAMRS